MALYDDVFKTVFGVSDSVLKEDEDLFRPRLRRAAKEFKSDHSHMFAINQCIHAANSIILDHPKNLETSLSRLKRPVAPEELWGKDPTFLLTVSALCCLIDWAAAQAAKEQTQAKDDKAAMEELRRGFDGMNWMIDARAARALGLIE